jgi:hypothetical protein
MATSIFIPSQYRNAPGAFFINFTAARRFVAAAGCLWSAPCINHASRESHQERGQPRESSSSFQACRLISAMAHFSSPVAAKQGGTKAGPATLSFAY